MDIQRRKKRLFLLFVVSVLTGSVIILSVMLVNITSTAESLAKSLIDKTIDKARIEMDKYFQSMVVNLKIARDLCDEGVLNASANSENDIYLLPLFNQISPLNTIVIADTLGNEYSVIREDTTWLSNIVYESKDSGMVILRDRWKGNLHNHKTIEKWTDYNVDYDPRTRTWFTGAMSTDEPDKVWWTDPYLFYTHKIPGITISLKSFCKSTKKYHVIEYDILLANISEFTMNSDVSRNGKAFVLSKDFKTIGLPKEDIFENKDSLQKYVLKDYKQVNSEFLNASIKNWKSKNNTSEPYLFKLNDKKWWSRITEYPLGMNNSFYIGVAVPEKDFLTEINKTRNIVIAGFLIVTLFIFMVIRQNNLRRKTNLLLGEQKDKIEMQHKTVTEQKKEITDSIEYAKQIQEALLPDDSFLKKEFSDHFVMLKPLHTVSGDFYWMKKIDNNVIIVAADCTGHGVPGAFMSMLGIAFLNEIVRKKNITKAGDALEELRSYVKLSLKQEDGSNSKDGMDVALYVIDTETLIMNYSGAFNPLYIIPDQNSSDKRLAGFKANPNVRIFEDDTISSNVIIEVKGDRQPVAVYSREQQFTNHEFQLQKNDILYTFSDGYQDQFGGEDGKKFKVRNLKKLLLKIHEKPMPEQRKILDDTITEWHKDFYQIDDILFLGLKI